MFIERMLYTGSLAMITLFMAMASVSVANSILYVLALILAITSIVFAVKACRNRKGRNSNG